MTKRIVFFLICFCMAFGFNCYNASADEVKYIDDIDLSDINNWRTGYYSWGYVDKEMYACLTDYVYLNDCDYEIIIADDVNVSVTITEYNSKMTPKAFKLNGSSIFHISSYGLGNKVGIHFIISNNSTFEDAKKLIVNNSINIVPYSVVTATPTPKPTATPTPKPTATPTPKPTATPSSKPTAEPTVVPTAEPTAVPTAEPTAEPIIIDGFDINAGLLVNMSTGTDLLLVFIIFMLGLILGVLLFFGLWGNFR